MENAAALIETGNTSPATLAPKVETTSVFKSFWPGRKASNVALNLEGESAMLFKIRQKIEYFCASEISLHNGVLILEGQVPGSAIRPV